MSENTLKRRLIKILEKERRAIIGQATETVTEMVQHLTVETRSTAAKKMLVKELRAIDKQIIDLSRQIERAISRLSKLAVKSTRFELGGR